MNKVDLPVFTYGDPANPPILFIHGFLYDHTMWEPMIERLKSSYYCITYDIRGLGKAPIDYGQYTLDGLAEDAISVLNFVLDEKAKVILCGFSMGGYIGFRLMELFPERFTAFAALDTRASADTTEAKIKRSNGIKAIDAGGVQAYVEGFMPNCFGEIFQKNWPDTYRKYYDAACSYHPIGVKGCLLAMMGRVDSRFVLSKMTIPVLAVVGEHDKFTPALEMQQMSAEIPGCEFCILPECGHMTPIENPDKVVELFRNWAVKNNL